MEKVEYKDTITVEFITKKYNVLTGEIEKVVPTSYSAFLEDFSSDVDQLVELTDITEIDDSTFWVNFYASYDTHTSISSNCIYFISFYWEKDGVKKCERFPVSVVINT